MRTRWKGILLAALACACTPDIGSSSGPVLFSARELSRPRLAIPTVPLDRSGVAPAVEPFDLPLGREQIINLERDVVKKGYLADPEAAIVRLLRDGMAVEPSARNFERFSQAYTYLAGEKLPVMVTSDSLLHLYHLYFNEILKAVETRALIPLETSLLEGLMAALLEMAPAAGGSLAEPMLNEIAYLAVPLRILKPDFEPHPQVRELVKADLARIEAHAGLEISWALSSQQCIESRGERGRCVREDFSQYVPRGHYTQSEALRRYFKATMWLGRIGHRFKHPDELRQAALLVQAMKTARCSYRGEEHSAPELLDRLDRVLGFFIGKSDDLSVYDLDPLLRSKLPAGGDLQDLADKDAMQRLQAALRGLRAPRILSGSVEATGKDAEGTVKQETQGLRLLGQRFAPDSEMLGRTVYEFTGPDPSHPRFDAVADELEAELARILKNDPQLEEFCGVSVAEFERAVRKPCDNPKPAMWRCLCERAKLMRQDCVRSGKCSLHAQESRNQAFGQVCRLMPSGLDIAAVLGSRDAIRLTEPSGRYCGYLDQRAKLAAEWAAALDRAPETLYLAWLGMLRPLLGERGQGYPTWMRTEAYGKKSLRSMLASWAELRHDTILYVKQSYTMKVETGVTSIGSPAVLLDAEYYGTVEPLPELMARLRRLTRQTRSMLFALQVLPEAVEGSLERAEGVFVRLSAIVDKELQEKTLDQADVDYINGIGRTFDELIAELTRAITPQAKGAAPEGAEPADVSVGGQDEAFKTTIVADVHTDLNTERVLEEGVGPVEWMLVASRNEDGSLSVSVGPVFSYFEFVHRLDDRLTNEKWRKRLAKKQVPPPAWWTDDRPLANGFELFCTPDTPGCAKDEER
ncbi:MAG: DUF3160 domain-containing protein [Deltaproteobacteria bacterium]|nr:DUF3160 domain-containing protein [Deltaproteobacteria bacterium]